MSGRTHDIEPTDMTAVTADDALLDALASGSRPTGDGLAGALADLRTALDTAYADAALPDTIPTPPTRRRLAQRGGFVAAAAVTVAVSLTGVAAAVGGNDNPIQRVFADIVGDRPAPDTFVLHARLLLDQAAALVSSATAQGFVTPADQQHADDLLTRAASDLLRSRDTDESARQGRRLADLRTALAALPVETPAPATSPTPEPGEDHGATATPEATHEGESGGSGGSSEPSDSSTTGGETTDGGGDTTEPHVTSAPDGGGDSSQSQPEPSSTPAPTQSAESAATDSANVSGD